MKGLTLTFAVLLSAGMAMSAPALAAGGGGGGSDGSSNSCRSGKVWDKKTKKCVNRSSSVDQDSLFEAGKRHADAGRYQEAIDILTLASADDKRVLNYLGYSYRKMGQVDRGLSYYRQAVAMDPEYTLVREYMGEALLQKGDLAGALEQLAEIRRLCESRTCNEYNQLSGEIAAYIKNQDG